MIATPLAADVKELSRLTKEEWREYTKTVWQIANTSDREHPAVFPPEIPHRLIKMFTFVGETVLDPFGGVGNTALAALRLDRAVVLVDQNPKYVEVAGARLAAYVDGGLTLRVGDSRCLDWIETDSIALIVTSPPYWNKVDYGDDPSNLGKIENYRSFLAAMRPVFEECYRVLTPGRKLCLVTANVNQYTEYGLLSFPVPADLGVLLRNVGFRLVNEIIWNKDGTGGKWGSYGAQRPIFGSYPYPPNFLFKTVHEHILVLAKPSMTLRTGPKVVPYWQIMQDVPGAMKSEVSQGNGARSPEVHPSLNGRCYRCEHGY